MQIKCGVCGVSIQDHDNVHITEFNTVVHTTCFEPVKDSGTFEDMKNKYDFLK